MLLEKVFQNTLNYHSVNISIPIIEKPQFLDLIIELSDRLEAFVEFWDILRLRDGSIRYSDSNQLQAILTSIDESIARVKSTEKTTILVIENILGFLDISQVDALTAAYLRSSIVNAIADFKSAKNKYLILLDTENNRLPQSMNAIVPTVDYPLPNSNQIVQSISLTIQEYGYQIDSGLLEKAAIASLGLSREEIKTALKSFLLEIDGNNTIALGNTEKEITLSKYLADPRDSVKNEKINRNTHESLLGINSQINGSNRENSTELDGILALSGSNLDFQQSNSSQLNKNLSQLKRILTPEKLIDRIVSYKKERLKDSGLEFMPPPDVKDFGGLDRLKAAIDRVAKDFSPQARDFNLPIPKGWLLVGPPGTGKTFSAKVCASKLGFPLISIGVDSVIAGGAAYLKQILLRIDAVGGAIAYFDEFDKFFADLKDSRTKEVLGVLLTWLAEKTSKTFVMATLNRFDNLPAELTRAGRFDRIWYVDFPHDTERYHIFTIHLSSFDSRYSYDGVQVKSPLSDNEWQILLKETLNFTGAEIRALVQDAARDCFYAGRQQINLDDLLKVRSQMTSLFARDPESICAMANRAKKYATPANSPDQGLFAAAPQDFWGNNLN